MTVIETKGKIDENGNLILNHPMKIKNKTVKLIVQVLDDLQSKQDEIGIVEPVVPAKSRKAAAVSADEDDETEPIEELEDSFIGDEEIAAEDDE